MSETKWVQHISGQGEKYPVYMAADEYIWTIQKEDHWLHIPKSEYRLCDPPEVYEDVSSECEAEHVSDGVIMRHCGKRFLWDRYRIRKVEIEREYPNAKQWAFIVERRKV